MSGVRQSMSGNCASTGGLLACGAEEPCVACPHGGRLYGGICVVPATGVAEQEAQTVSDGAGGRERLPVAASIGRSALHGRMVRIEGGSG